MKETVLTKEEVIAKIVVCKRRFRVSCIAIVICLMLLILNKFIAAFYVGNVAPIIVLIVAVLAAVGYYGQYRTLEQKEF